MPDPAELMPDPPPGLGPTVRAEAWSAERVTACGVAGDAANACLLLWHDRLDAAHALVQRHEGERDCDVLHAILHRREPDAGNARYWWRRAGGHPLAAELAAEALRLGLGRLVRGELLDPGLMVESCIARSEDPALVALQACELRLLAARLLAP